MNKTQKCCCSGSDDCCTPKQHTAKKFIIDFLYLDLSICTRCQGADKALDEAIADVSHVLKAAGYDVAVNKVNITTKELAIKYQFVSSPTIRVNGHDIDVDVKESRCESCGDLCGDSVDCRVWTYQGVEYTEPPKALLINALLQEAYGAKRQPLEQDYVLPKNLENFFDSLASKKK